MTASEFETLRADLRALRADVATDISTQVSTLRIEWRQEMLTHIRWLVGLFVVQFIATVGATAGIVGWMLNVIIGRA
jgi:nitrate reductase NapE component